VPELRDGMWAVLFTDLTDSTAQRVRVGDEAADDIRREHDEIVASAVSEHRGVWVKGLGDGAMTAFAACADALAAAVDIQQRVARRNLDAREPIAVRIGLSVGDVHAERGDLHGMAVNEAARLCAAADGGSILVTDMAKRVAGSRAHCSFVDHGVYSLKGLPSLVVWRVEWKEQPTEELGGEVHEVVPAARRHFRPLVGHLNLRRLPFSSR
jgi:class 3 adenylate cyclase